MKRLVVCFDGTWNSPSQEDNGIPSPTNVYKISRAIPEKDPTTGTKQLTYYHTGVGTEGGKISKILDGAFGKSLGEHIMSGYHWLAQNYEESPENDEIFLFGFSRGAFTVRSLSGMIGTVGLLNLEQSELNNSEKWEAINKGYTAYRKKGRKLIEFQKEYKDYFFNQGKPVDIKFIGVWDTVGAAGIPDDAELLNAIFDKKHRWEFHNKKLGAHVKHARHAMALDEKRSSFTVTRWIEADDHQDMKEMWFPGVHSDVGGGYADSSLSDIALEWMIKEAEVPKIGLHFDDFIKKQLKPDPEGEMHNSFQGIFSALRSRPRNIPLINTNTASIHESVINRQDARLIKYPEYWPTCSLDLEKKKSTEIDVFAVKRWNYTGIYMNEGEEYIFSADGEWVDRNDVCDWLGTEKDDDFTLGDIGRFFGTAWGKLEQIFEKGNKSTDFWGTKRVEQYDWFSMIGAIANDKGEPDPVKNDGSPTPHTYISLPEFQDTRHPYVVKHPGYFYAFTNDAWHFYNNNKGSIRLTIQRIK